MNFFLQVHITDSYHSFLDRKLLTLRHGISRDKFIDHGSPQKETGIQFVETDKTDLANEQCK